MSAVLSDGDETPELLPEIHNAMTQADATRVLLSDELILLYHIWVSFRLTIQTCVTEMH